MKHLGKTIKGVVFGAVLASIAAPMNAEDNLHLWYPKPASYWEEALPLGNGRLAAMVSGSVAQDTIHWQATSSIMRLLLSTRRHWR